MEKIVVPFWKYWWSYITDVHLEMTSSDLNPQLEVLLSKGKLQLCTKNAIYSHADRYDNFKVALREVLPQLIEQPNVLVLGLGLGSIHFMLEHTFKKDAFLTAVELDEEIVRLCQEYVLHLLKRPGQIIVGDGEEFVYNCMDEFDLICMDIFEDDVIPQAFLQIEFLESLNEILLPGGWVIYNHLGNKPEEIIAGREFFDVVFSAVFEDARIISHPTNLMLAGKRRGY